jgi:subtilisin family serine protease
VASRLVEQGVIITMSAGNKGETAGMFWSNQGSNADGVLAVASMAPSTVAVRPFTAVFSRGGVQNFTTLGYDPSRYTAPNSNFEYNWNIQDREIVVLSFDAPATEACATLPADTPSLAGKIPLIRVEGCPILDKQRYLELAGADHALFYSLAGGLEKLSTNTTVPKVGVIETKTALEIIHKLKAGGKVTISVDPAAPNYVQAGLTSGGIPSAFTTWGGLYDLKVKPDLAGPGANILSAKWSGFDNQPTQYMSQSGTSMSCPYVAGVAALYVERYGGRKSHGPGFAKRLVCQIIASGNTLPWNLTKTTDGQGHLIYENLAPITQVGSGNIDAWKLLTYKSSLSFEKIALNDTSNFKGTHSITVTNGHNIPVEYRFGLQPAAGVEAQGPRPYDLAVKSEISPVSIIPEVVLPSIGLTLMAGETKTFEYVWLNDPLLELVLQASKMKFAANEM